MDDIINGKFQNIIVLSGAGVSVNANIPDYRSPNGIFQQMASKYNISTPEILFSRSYTEKHPEIHTDELYQGFIQKMREANPTSSHNLCKVLHDKGYLKRVYIQNIDELYNKAGLDADKIVEFHGSINKEVTLYGDTIKQKVMDSVKKDFIDDVEIIDCIIVMGTSLQVAPFCALPNMVRKYCCRILVNKTPQDCYRNSWSQHNEPEGMYSNNSQISYMKIHGRKVTLKPYWQSKGKWKNQYIYKMDCDAFSNEIINKIMNDEKIENNIV